MSLMLLPRLLLMALIPLLLALVGPVRAATYAVSTVAQLDAAVTKAQSGDTIQIATGTYALDQTLQPQGGVTLSGAGAGQSKLDGGQARRVLSVGPGVSLTLAGLTLQNGFSSGSDEYGGGGIINFGTLTLTGCALTGNSVEGIDGGTGGGLDNEGTATLTGCALTGNIAEPVSVGGALYNGYGGGVYNFGTLTLTGCALTGDSAQYGFGGGLENQAGTATLVNCVFAGDTASGGGSLYNFSTMTVTGCTLTGNSGGVLYTDYASTATLTDDILYGNTGGEINDNGGSVSASYCDIQGGYAGTGDLNAAPLFVTPYTNSSTPFDLHVQPGSPVVGAGIYESDDTTDITGATRANPPTIGAYEGQTAPTTTSLTSSLNPSAVGQPVTFTATVKNATPGGPVPTGSVSFSYGVPADLPGEPPDFVVLGTVTLSGGQAQLKTSTLPAGAQTAIAVYNPGHGFITSSVGLNQTVELDPTANAQTVSVVYGTPQALTLTGSDPNSPPQPLTYAIATQPAHGRLSVLNASTGAVTYSSYVGYLGADSFTFTVSNGIGTSAPATVSLTIAAATQTGLVSNLNPSAVGQSVTFTATVTDATPGGPVPTGSVSFSYFVPPASPNVPPTFVALGTITLSGEQAQLKTSALPAGVQGILAAYNPAAGFTASDVGLNQTVLLTPTANAQSISVAFNTPKALTLTGSDPNSPAQPLTYAIATQPAHGTLGGTAPNLTYTPSAGYSGPDSFTFTVSNGPGTSAPATVSLSIAVGVPTAIAQSVTTSENTAKGITLTGSDPDVPALVLTYVVATQPTHGTLIGTAPNLTYTPATGYSGSDSFTFTVSNGTNTSAPAPVNITVSRVYAAVTGLTATWGTQTAPLGLGGTLLPAGRNTDVPWQGIKSFTLTLSVPETLAAGDVSVTGVRVANYGLVTVSGSGTSYTVTLRTPISAADRVTLKVGNTGITAFTGTLPVLPGDVSDDGTVTASDLVLERNAISATYSAYADINGDGAVNVTDYTLLRALIGTTLP